MRPTSAPTRIIVFTLRVPNSGMHHGEMGLRIIDLDLAKQGDRAGDIVSARYVP